MSCHLTIGTFNYVVKDPDCIRISGQFWIKDIGGQSHYLVSSNLMRCCTWSLQQTVSQSMLASGLATVFCATSQDYRTSLSLSTCSVSHRSLADPNPAAIPSGCAIRICIASVRSFAFTAREQIAFRFIRIGEPWLRLHHHSDLGLCDGALRPPFRKSNTWTVSHPLTLLSGRHLVS